MSELDVTILIATRERHSLALQSLNSIFEHTPAHVPIVYADLGSPASVTVTLRESFGDRPVTYCRFDGLAIPQLARIALIDQIRTRYVVFIDNDVLVEPLWLEKLVACADETGAALVGPLYLWGDGDAEPLIHMAGGKLERFDDAAGHHLTEQHLLMNEPVEVVAGWTRRPVDFLEYHCMLARTSFVQAPGMLSDVVTTIHEHIDLALKAHELGEQVLLEPACRINYLGKNRHFTVSDLAYLRQRWARDAAETSIAGFAQRWGVTDAPASFDPVRGFRSAHLLRYDLLQPDHQDRLPSQRLATTQLAQTRFQLLRQMATSGYSSNQLNECASALSLAMVMADGMYRCDGRPFLNHLIGTASVLVYFQAKVSLVIAGLLHAALSHRPASFSHERACLTLTRIDRWVADLVAAYPERKRALFLRPLAPDDLLPDDVAIVLMEAANEADMILSGEYAVSGRNDGLTGQALADVVGVLNRMNLTALADTLTQPPVFEPWAAQAGFRGMHMSFRINADSTGLETVTIQSSRAP